jgi:hypothetical protein
MLTLFLYLSLASYLTTCHSLTHVAQDRRPPRIANPGETAIGEVMMEEGGQLQLNTKPCDEQRVVIIFQKPFVTESAGTINCEGRAAKKLVRVLKK